jgi:hypothetical protein
MNWKFFLGACILAAGLAIRSGAPMAAVVMGLALAGLLNWTRQRALMKARKR